MVCRGEILLAQHGDARGPGRRSRETLDDVTVVGMTISLRTALLVWVVAMVAAGCGSASGTDVQPTRLSTTPTATAETETASEPRPNASEAPAAFSQTLPEGDQLDVRVIDRRPHDPTAFTQGLEFHEGELFESRGLFADNEDVVLAQIDPADGTTVDQVTRDPADGDYFAEGLTVVGDRIIQITWQSNTAYVYDRDTLERTGQFTYQGEGWGLCDQPDRLVMSNGTPTLTFRDQTTFEELGTVTVTQNGEPVERLNELECVGGLVLANVWQTDTIVVIQPDTGDVISQIDASGLLTPEEQKQADVLNGIAYDPIVDAWLLTGKLWPWMFEVEFDCTEGCETATVPSHYIRSRTGSPSDLATR